MAIGIFKLRDQLQGLIQNAWSGTSPSNAPKYLEYLVVAGGGGGGTENSGGGGAGGVLQGLLPIVLGSSYTVTVGSGGAGVAGGGASNTTGGVGLNSIFGSITAIGGGGGGSRFSPVTLAATAGGSGGGAGGSTSIAPGAAGTFGQGNAGGIYNPGSPVWGGAGGGGAGTSGINSISGGCAGAGGAGISSAISGTVTAYAGGGGGGTRDTQIVGVGGVGGGGTGANATSATSGSTNSGGGGGGGGQATSGGNGGSGIVIVRYRGNVRFFSGGTLSYDSVNNYTVHTFYASGTLAPLATPTTYGTTSSLTKSLRFRASNSAYLSRTPSVASNRKTWTWSGWVKRTLQSNGALFSVSTGPGAYQQTSFYFSGDSLRFYSDLTISADVKTSAVYRDTSAWYHFVCAFDTTQATASDRVKIYVNGVLQTALSATTYPTQNTDGQINNTSYAFEISRSNGATFLSDYLAEVNFIDGQALTPQAFGQYDATSGVWSPMKFVGTYGTNGFYLPFTDTTSTTTLGYDSSGNGNNLATSGFSLTAGSTYDSMNDVPTLTSATAANYAVLNPISSSASFALTNGNLSTPSNQDNKANNCTIGVSTGKWYWEVVVNNNSSYCPYVGVTSFSQENDPDVSPGLTSTAGRSAIRLASPYTYKNYTATSNATGSTNQGSTGTIGVALNLDAGEIKFYNGNTLFHTDTTIPTNGTILFPYVGVTNSGIGSWNSTSLNFGQQPFVYTPPAGFVALNTYNLPTPAIVRGNQYMDASLYNGNGGAQAINNNVDLSNGGGLIWIKGRNLTIGHYLTDSVRGYTRYLQTNSTDAEYSDGPTITTSTGGFSFNSASLTLNALTYTYVAWQWKAGGTAVSNTAGAITSSVSANTTAGFSIVTWTGTGTGSTTVGHGLSTLPQFVIIKKRSTTSGWYVASYASGQGLNYAYHLFLNTTGALDSNNDPYYLGGQASLTSNVLAIAPGTSNTGGNENGTTYVAYCWTPVAGYSAFGSYIGNGNVDGPFVYTGFKPRFVMIKDATNAATQWTMLDSARNNYNVVDARLIANLNNAENAQNLLDFTSNGFKLRDTYSVINTSGANLIYMAFAECPFKYANAR